VAKVEITIEDIPGNKVSIKSNPSMETMIKMEISGSNELTSAHGYAYACLNEIRKLSKSQDPTNKLIIPRLK
jgi:hypothetical protein